MSDVERLMSLAEMADYLKITEERLRDLAESGGVPAIKDESQWRFMRSVVDDWLIGYMKKLPKDDLHRLVASHGGAVSLRSLLRSELVTLSVRPGTKEQVLRQLVAPLTSGGLLTAAEEARLVERLIDREEMVSTAIFAGAAIPHPRNPEEPLVKRPIVALGVCPRGTEFDSLDMESTYVFFLVCAGNEMLHLKLIAEIALQLRKPRLVERLRAAPGPAQALAELFE